MIELLEATPLKEPLIFDTHAHYDDRRFEELGDDLFFKLHENGVGYILSCGCDVFSSKKALSLAEKFPFVYAAVGVHPSNINDNSNLIEIERLASHEKCVAIGEIGLDYYWVKDNKNDQKEFFTKQLELAKKLDLPVLVHDRDAHEDTLAILSKFKPKGVVHSFSGSTEMAEKLIEIGMYIGVGGVITFKNAKKLPEVVANIPSERLLLETDAPYLAPEPFRGKTNNSTLIYFSAQKIAEIRKTTTKEILNITLKNAKKLFSI